MIVITTRTTHFNPRSRKESDKLKDELTQNKVLFQSTLSQGERRWDIHRKGAIYKFQSTLSQGERHVVLTVCDRLKVISIHALARRATIGKFITTGLETNFNPRSRKESDIDKRIAELKSKLFQSTLSQGERPNRYKYASMRETISIHALARRATTVGTNKRINTYNFNPRSRKESDAKTDNNTMLCKDFNPRSRKESDPIVINTPIGAKRISIHALARRATCHLLVVRLIVIDFNPRSRKESDTGYLAE